MVRVPEGKGREGRTHCHQSKRRVLQKKGVGTETTVKGKDTPGNSEGCRQKKWFPYSICAPLFSLVGNQSRLGNRKH